MRNNRDFQGDNFIKKRKIHKYLRRVVALLSAFVLLFTVNTLKRNANTLERIATCGYEEHVHDAGCYDAAGALICGLEEHVHTDACYQAAPTEVEVQLGDEEEQDLPLEDDGASLEPENVFVEENPVEEPKVFSLSEPTPVSAIVEAMKLDVDLGRVIEVGAIVDDAEHEGLLDVQPMDGGDWMVSALREFDDAELALVLEDDILIVDLENKAPAQPQEAEIQAEQTEVDPEPTEDGQAIEEQTEVDTVVEEQPGEETPVEGVEADLSEVTADAPETADVEASDENPEISDEITDETAETSDVEATDENNTETTDETAEASDVEATDENNTETTDETAETSDVEAADENPEITDETAETSDVEATDENNTETTDETAEAEPETADEPSEETSDENPEAADEPSEETSDENPETTDEPSEEAGDEQDVDEAAQDGQAADAEPEETDEATEETSDETADAVEKQPDVSVTVDLSSVDLMGAASVEADTVKLNVADLLNAEDAAVERSGDLTVDTADFVDAATVVAADNVAVEDGVITLTAEAMEAGSVTMALESEDEDAEPQVVEIALSGYTGRVTDEIASDPAVQIVPAEGNSLPADAFAAVKSGDVPQELLDSEAAEDENIIQSAKAYDITITNANEDEISNTGAVEVTLTPSDLDVLVDVPETATVNKLDYELYHIHDDGTCEKVEDAVFDVAEDGTLNSVSFTTESFSTYVVKYTVDFTYVDAEGNERFWQFPGSGSHALREVLSELGIEGEVITDASLELTEQVDEAGENDLYLTQDLDTQEYFINSDAPFDDTYTLTVTVDEVVYTIIVTDDQQAAQTVNPNWTVTVNLYNNSGAFATGTELASTNEMTYGVMAVLYDKYLGEPLGYKMASIDGFDNNATKTVNFDLSECRKLTQSNGAWVDAGDSAGTISVNPSEHDIQFEIFEATTSSNFTYRIDRGALGSKKYEEVYGYSRGVSGFEYKAWPDGHVVNMSDNTASLNFTTTVKKQYNLRFEINPATLGIPQNDRYYALVTLNAGLSNEMSGFAPICFNAGESVVDIPITQWYDSSEKELNNVWLVGNEPVSIKIYYKDEGNSRREFSSWKSLKDEQSKTLLADGSSLYGRHIWYGTPLRVVEANKICDVITFTEPTGTLTRSYIESFLGDARDFGYYTEWYKGQTGDIEATIGAKVMSTEFADGFGYSQRNVKVNTLKVKKVYTNSDGTPVNPSENVTIILKKDGEEVARESGQTDSNGILELEFDGLEPGKYTVTELINGKEIEGNSAYGEGEITEVATNYSSMEAWFVENGNVNYFGTIDYAKNPEGDVKLATLLDKGSRVPMVILTDDQDTVDRINRVNNNKYSVEAYVNGTAPYKSYNITSDMEKLRALSNELSTKKDSSDVRVVNIKASQISEEGLSFEDDGRFIVVNVYMNQQTFCPMVKLGGRVLEGDFGRGGKENSTKVLFNLRNADGTKGYGVEQLENGQEPPEFNTNKTGAGVILAPWANAHILGGVFGGTIISKVVDRKGNEIHSDNPNQRQTLNITIQNIKGTPQVGMLELRKEYPENSNIKDRITYFPFKVTLTNTTPSKVQGQSFPASGLKDDEDEVTFDDKGEATVWVRADNSVTIANLPAGTTYTVTEELTEDLAKLYTFVGAKDNDSGTIQTGKTDSVTLINDVPKTGLKLKKVLEDSSTPDVDFHFNLYLWREDEENHTFTALTDTALESVTVTGAHTSLNFDNSGTYDTGADTHAATVSDEFTLKAGQQLVVDGLPQGVNYAFVELTDKTHMPAGYQVVTPNGKVTGTLPTHNQATIINKYVVKLGVQKEWRNSDAKNAELYLVRYKKIDDSASAPSANSSTNTPADPLVIDGGSNGSGDDNQIGGDSTGDDNGQGQGDSNEQSQGNNPAQTVTTRDVLPVSITWTGSGTIASGATVTATATRTDDPSDSVQATLSASNSWSSEFSGLTVGKTYNVTFAVNGDANATVDSVNGFVVDNSNSIATNGTVTEQVSLLSYVPITVNWVLDESMQNAPDTLSYISQHGFGSNAGGINWTSSENEQNWHSGNLTQNTTSYGYDLTGVTEKGTQKNYVLELKINNQYWNEFNSADNNYSVSVTRNGSPVSEKWLDISGNTTERQTFTVTISYTGNTNQTENNSYHVKVYALHGSDEQILHSSDYPANSNLTFSLSVPSWNNNSANGYGFSINKGSTISVQPGETKSQAFTLNSDCNILITGQTPWYTDWVTVSVTGANPVTAFAAPFQLAWSPFVAYAEDYTTLRTADKVAEAVARSGMVAPDTGYVLDADWGLSIPVTKTETYKTVENLPVYDENGNEYYYAVVEASQISGYDVTYAVGENGTVTTTPTPVKASTLTGQTLVTLKAINTYRYVSATPKVKKYLDGQKYEGHLSDKDNTAEVFNFTLTQIQPEGTYTDTAQTNTNGDVVGFDTITFTQAGTYIYEITEDKGSSDKVSYTDRAVYWKVIVENKGGKLVKTKDAYYTDAEHDTLIDQKGEEAGFYNKELIYVNVEKKWSLNLAPADYNFPENGNPPEVKVYLHRIGPGVVSGTEDVIINPATGRKADYDGDKKPYVLKYNSDTKQYDTLHIGNLLKYSTNASNQNTLYTYYIVEAEENMQGWKPSLYYANNGEGKPTASAATVTGGGTLTVVNSKSYVALPATGGVGTGVIYAAGAGLLALALAWWLARMRKRDYDA